jgi:hypothetical protein
MADARARLKHLVDLAASDAAQDRARLVEDLCELLLDWPGDYPLSMRAPFERLLEKAAEDVGSDMRASLATRLAALPDAPVGLLNRLFFDAPDPVKNAILRRNALANEDAPDGDGQAPADEAALITAARANAGDDLAQEFARVLGVEGGLAKRILDEPSGGALAAACKGAHLKRTTFSALAVLFAPETIEKERRLGAYDEVPLEGAESLVRFWRLHPQTGAHHAA